MYVLGVLFGRDQSKDFKSCLKGHEKSIHILFVVGLV